MKNSKPTLAVIGTGIAGLSSAFLLKDSYDVTVYESASRAGMGVHTIDYSSQGKASRIDVPLRIFCKGYYQNLMALYNHIGVDVESSDHAGAFANEKGKMLFHYGNLNAGSLTQPFLKGRSLFQLNAWRIAVQSELFFRRAKKDVTRLKNLSDLTFGEYLQSSGAGQLFVDTILLPMMAVTCTCDYNSVKNYPADMMLGYLTCGVREFGILSAAKGVDDIVPRLLNGINLKTDCPIKDIESEGEGLRVTETRSGNTAVFDHVVVASQAQQAAEMLNSFRERQSLLRAVPFESSYMSVHTDDSLLPRSVVSVSPVTYRVPDQGERAEVTVDLTKAISRFQGQSPVFQTWHPIKEPAVDTEIARIKFTRPVVTHGSRQAVNKLQSIHSQPDNRLWLCGSYMADKIPLLDAAVDSSVAIAQQLGVSIPWTVTDVE